MKKSDLKDGMVCLCRNGNYYLVLGGRLIRNSSWNGLSAYEDNLTIGKGFDEFDIMKVYTCNKSITSTAGATTPGKLLWERPTALIPGKYYVDREQFIFKYEGLKKDNPDIEGLENAIVYSMFLNLKNPEHHHIGKKKVGIGCYTDPYAYREATPNEIESLYLSNLEKGKAYVIDETWIFTYTYVDSIGQIYFSKCYDLITDTLDDDAGAVCEISEVESIREATEKEINLVTPTLIPGNYYTIGYTTFRYLDIKKNVPSITVGSEDAIVFTMMGNPYCADLCTDIGVGTPSKYCKPATVEEVEQLYNVCLKPGHIYYVDNDNGTKFIFEHSKVKENSIYSSRHYSFDRDTIYSNLTKLAWIHEVKTIREATEEEIKLLNPIQELTIAELEQKLGMQSGTLRIKK